MTEVILIFPGKGFLLAFQLPSYEGPVEKFKSRHLDKEKKKQ